MNEILFVTQVPTNYDFVYSVHDSYSGDDHSHQEKKTNHLTQGQYTVKLPDGRTQVRKYGTSKKGKIKFLRKG